MEKIPLIVGNENDDPLYKTNLKEYLCDFRNYQTNPKSWKGKIKSLYCEEKDENVIVSSQCCLLPTKKLGNCEFNVSVYNHYSTQNSPKILAILSNSEGTSSQLINDNSSKKGQTLFFNKNGIKKNFVSQRVSDIRRSNHLNIEGDVSSVEEQKNRIFVILVPVRIKNEIKKEEKSLEFTDFNFTFYSDDNNIRELEIKSIKKQENIENSFINLQEKKENKNKKESNNQFYFPDFIDLEIERDTRFPVRIIIQYYKSVCNNLISEETVSNISKQLNETRKLSSHISSLVLNETGRTTEYYSSFQVASWWSKFWFQNKTKYSHLDEREAISTIFKNERLIDSSLEEVEKRIDTILKGKIEKINWNF